MDVRAEIEEMKETIGRLLGQVRQLKMGYRRYDDRPTVEVLETAEKDFEAARAALELATLTMRASRDRPNRP